MDSVKEKLVELLKEISYDNKLWCYDLWDVAEGAEDIADVLIAHGVTFATDNNVGSKWIPVTERLPEDNGRYLCNVKSFAFPGCFYQAILQCDKHGFREGNIYTDDVTHWMPLPLPPKGE